VHFDFQRCCCVSMKYLEGWNHRSTRLGRLHGYVLIPVPQCRFVFFLDISWRYWPTTDGRLPHKKQRYTGLVLDKATFTHQPPETHPTFEPRTLRQPFLNAVHKLSTGCDVENLEINDSPSGTKIMLNKSALKYRN
jgi:hypothetical protein